MSTRGPVVRKQGRPVPDGYRRIQIEVTESCYKWLLKRRGRQATAVTVGTIASMFVESAYEAASTDLEEEE